MTGLKRNRHRGKRKQPKPGRDAVAEAQTAISGRPPPPKWRRWVFRFVAAVGVPLLLLGGLELGLRVAGYGHPTSFFVREKIDDREVLVENERFGLRFFPTAVARSPSAVVVEAEKPAETCRIFLFGGSAALGDPRPAYGMGRYLEVLLQERFPDRRFEVVCVAMTAINSHAVLPIARECAALRGDIWVVYMGNNEMAGRFGANTVLGPQAPPWPLVRASLAFQATRTGQWLEALRERWLPSAPTPETWAGLKMFLEARIPPRDPRREAVYRNFAANLNDILEAGVRAGAKVVLSTVASNLKDCGPFASLPAPTTPASAERERDQAIGRGQAREATGDLAGALAAYEQAAAASPDFAETAFRQGRCLLNLERPQEAAAAFDRARDLDALPFRCDSRLNALIVAAGERFAGRGVRLLDAEALLAGDCAGEIPGAEVFFEHVHLNFTGNYRMARGIAEEVWACLGKPPAPDPTGEWASQQRCDFLLALTDWNRQAIYREVLGRLADAPFTNQLDHAEQITGLKRQLAQAEAGARPSEFKEALANYEAVLQRRPDDFRIREGFAELLEANGDLVKATEQWQQVQHLLPRHPAGWFHAGRLLAQQQRFAEAEPFLVQALALRPDLAPAHRELARVYLQEHRIEEALAHFDAAGRLRPNDARLRFEMADILAANDRRDEALGYLREAIRIQPDYWEARYLLGVELAVREEVSEAAEQFAEVVRLQPQFVRGHLNLGVAWVRLGRIPEAIEQFRQTLAIEPDNAQAAQYLRTLAAPAKTE